MCSSCVYLCVIFWWQVTTPIRTQFSIKPPAVDRTTIQGSVEEQTRWKDNALTDFAFEQTCFKQILYFEWSPPWHFKAFRALVPTLSYKSHCKTHSIVLSEAKSFVCHGAYRWHSFWHSIWYIFGDSLWLRSGGEHSDPEPAVEVRRETLWSGACGGGPAGITLIQGLLFGSGGEHCDLELAIEVRRRKEEEGGRRRAGWQKIYNNPHLTGGGKKRIMPNVPYCFFKSTNNQLKNTCSKCHVLGRISLYLQLAILLKQCKKQNWWYNHSSKPLPPFTNQQFLGLPRANLNHRLVKLPVGSY